MPKPTNNRMSIQFDLSDIGLRENYKLNLLTRLGGKVKFYLKVAKLCDKIKEHYELSQYFEDYDMRELHKCLVDILNSAFQDLPELFNVKAHFEQRHQKLIDAGMKSNDFDIFIFEFEATLWDTSVDETVITDAVKLLKPLRKVFRTVLQKSNMNRSQDEPSPVSNTDVPSVWELVEQRKQEKIQSRLAKLERSRSKKLQKKLSSIKKTKSLLEESSRSVSTEDMTILSADDLCETNWESSAYQSWNNVM